MATDSAETTTVRAALDERLPAPRFAHHDEQPPGDPAASAGIAPGARGHDGRRR